MMSRARRSGSRSQVVECLPLAYSVAPASGLFSFGRISLAVYPAVLSRVVFVSPRQAYTAIGSFPSAVSICVISVPNPLRIDQRRTSRSRATGGAVCVKVSI